MGTIVDHSAVDGYRSEVVEMGIVRLTVPYGLTAIVFGIVYSTICGCGLVDDGIVQSTSSYLVEMA